MEAVKYYEESQVQDMGEKKKTYTVADILALPEGVRAELLDGEMFMMASPGDTHQRILGWLYVVVATHIRGKKGKCRVRVSPYAVFLMNDDKNYVEPDLLVVCDSERIQSDGIHCGPDWAVEIVSPSSRTMDYKRKVAAYEKAGVREYWIIDPKKEAVVVYNLDEGWIPECYHFTDCVPSQIVEGLEVDFAELVREWDSL